MEKKEVYRSRINILVRLIGLIFVVLGLITAYLVSTTPLHPQTIPTFYFISALLTIAGLVSLAVRLK